LIFKTNSNKMINTLKSKKSKYAQWVCSIALLACTTVATAQEASLTLEQCYTLAQANYPLTKQRGLIEETKNYTISNIAKGVYPQFGVNGTATYQSDVTKIAIPGFKIPTVSKDQYKLYGEVSQTLTGFGINRQNRQISEANAELQQQNLETQLYALKERINQVFFGILLIDGQLEENRLSKQDIQTGINTVAAAVNNGTNFKSNLSKLQAELLKNDQRTIDLLASRKAYTDMLALFINQPVTGHTLLVKPVAPVVTDSIYRPELKAYNLQVKAYQLQQQLIKLNNYPQVSAFFQGGVGQPSPVNLLATGFSGYYLTGLRLSWNIGWLYTLKKDLLINKNNQLLTDAQRNTFLFNTSLSLKQQNADAERYRQLMQTDNDIIALREQVKKASAAQLANGVITTNDYVQDVNAESLARQDRALHEIQWLMALYAVKTTAGN
jgi:outer membrane protein TolC